jgi:hypothetical protein
MSGITIIRLSGYRCSLGRLQQSRRAHSGEPADLAKRLLTASEGVGSSSGRAGARAEDLTVAAAADGTLLITPSFTM